MRTVFCSPESSECSPESIQENKYCSPESSLLMGSKVHAATRNDDACFLLLTQVFDLYGLLSLWSYIDVELNIEPD